jgi:RimJ/RimL family protein N-acetyltransferase
MTNDFKVTFLPLCKSHFEMIHDWFNKPHVQLFYSLREWTLEEVAKKLTPYLQHVGQIKGYIIYLNECPIGYIQSYPIKEHPWENQDLLPEVVEKAAGFDLFIGEENYLNRGFGCKIVDCFLNVYIWPSYRYCFVDPDICNTASINLFKKCGFTSYQQINGKDGLQRQVTLKLFMKENE